MIIRISLLLFLASLAVFLGSEVLLRLALPNVSELMMQLGLALLLSAFALLVMTGMLAVCGMIMRSVAHYFSFQQRIQRRLLFMQVKQEQVKQLFHFRALQMKYFNELKRDSLLKTNNRKHIRALAKSIQKELLLIKKNISAATFKQLQLELTRYRSQQDFDALLKLQQRITDIT